MRIVRFCSAVSAVSPPASSITVAIPIMHAPQNTTTSLFGAGLPWEDMVPITTDAESADVTKKIVRTAISRNGVIVFRGS